MSTPAFSAAFAAVGALVKKFDAGRAHYMSAAYQEAQARQEFIDKFWTALGWDVTHEHQHNPYQQEVFFVKDRKGLVTFALQNPF